MSCDKNKRKFEELEAENDELRLKLALPNVRQALLGERLMDVIGIVAAGGGRHFGDGSGAPPSQGFAADVSHCLNLCKLTRVIVQRSDVADMLTQSLRLQCSAREAHAAKREDFPIVRMAHILDVGNIFIAQGTTQLIRATLLNNLPRVLQLIQLGAPLDLVDKSERGYSALHWACSEGLEHVAKALLAGKYVGKGATVDLRSRDGRTPLMSACFKGHKALVTLLIKNGAKQDLQDEDGYTPLHYAIEAIKADDDFGVVELLLAAPGAADALMLKVDGCTPLKFAIDNVCPKCEALLRAAGAKDEDYDIRVDDTDEEDNESEEEDEEEEEDEDEEDEEDE